MSKNRSRRIWRTTRRPSCRSKGSTSTYCHKLWDVPLKVVADVGVKLKQIYLRWHSSHHPNNTPQ
jgi:hypothetical protein